MKAKEKAKELHRKFYLLIGDDDSWDRAKQCALIAVDEIIKEIPTVGMFGNRAEYWRRVKQEINKL